MSPNNRQDLPYFYYFHADLLLSTEDWPTFERVIYLWLLVANWYRGVIPTSERALAQLCGMALADFRPIWRARLRKKFVKAKGGLTNERIARDRVEAFRLRELAIEAGRRGGKASANARRGVGPQPISDVVTNFADRMKLPPK
jgi:uncharacterized protein YdaU (DUF1376 family)